MMLECYLGDTLDHLNANLAMVLELFFFNINLWIIIYGLYIHRFEEVLVEDSRDEFDMRRFGC